MMLALWPFFRRLRSFTLLVEASFAAVLMLSSSHVKAPSAALKTIALASSTWATNSFVAASTPTAGMTLGTRRDAALHQIEALKLQQARSRAVPSSFRRSLSQQPPQIRVRPLAVDVGGAVEQVLGPPRPPISGQDSGAPQCLCGGAAGPG